ncbi:acylneuraminate cytidylyltransferase family protein [Altererythrobacter sp. MF3-039]|uniref:acylneuraminate cytidylyltransferase family protein n=1 Tax=Altererythrobacter sp. MF3-039 TaxID=3252901 RepID=UPI00390CD415
MIDLALIPARGGSKGLPRKNVLPLGGVPLIGWTIRAALASGICRRVVVSTDDKEIAGVARSLGASVPFMRPPELSGDLASSDAVLLHALDVLEVQGAVALLQPTSPFRNARHLAKCSRHLSRGDISGIISVTEGKPLAWANVMVEERLFPALADKELVPRRQDHKVIYYPNGAIFCATTEQIKAAGGVVRENVIGYPMSSIDSLDIDNQDDFCLAAAIADAKIRQIDG